MAEGASLDKYTLENGGCMLMSIFVIHESAAAQDADKMAAAAAKKQLGQNFSSLLLENRHSSCMLCQNVVSKGSK